MIEIKKQDLEKLIFEKKLSYVEIGKMYGCSSNNIKKRAKKMGIKLPERRKKSPKETFNKGKQIKFIDNKSICPKCGKKKYYKSNLCMKCASKEKVTIRNKKLGDYIGYDEKEKYVAGKCNEIRRDARKFMENESKQEKVCVYCKNHEFDEILEVHHLKNILSFSPETKISQINCDENLVWICPNHHAMLEKGLIELKK